MLNKLIPWRKRGENLSVGFEDHSLSRLRHEFDRIWDRFWDDWRGGGLSSFDSLADWDENEKEYVVRLAVPGFEPDDFDIKVSGNTLTLRAEHKEEHKAKKSNGNYHRYGSYYETMTLPQGVLADKVDARYHSGILELRLPKSEECKAKRIEVKSA